MYGIPRLKFKYLLLVPYVLQGNISRLLVASYDIQDVLIHKLPQSCITNREGPVGSH